jgi:nucleotide-binding universal stress UspA family protein
MVSLTRILVPTDFGTAAETALSYARDLSRTCGASLHLLHVLENPFLKATVADPRQLEVAALRQLVNCLTEDDRRILRARSIVETSDHPADSIVAYAQTANIDLIVMGTHGRTAIERLLLGSVAERVIRTAPCPVLTVKGPEHRATGPEMSAERHRGPTRDSWQADPESRL